MMSYNVSLFQVRIDACLRIQTILIMILGESGAGKTEASKQIQVSFILKNYHQLICILRHRRI